MASPVDTSVKWADCMQTGAPVVTGVAGTRIAALDALLVNGWGLATATSVVVSSGVATATFASDHAAVVDSVVLVAGATPAGLNGEQKITAKGTNTISWATAEANGTATGTITVKMAAAGWTKSFSDTNLAVYKSSDPASNGHFLRVADTDAVTPRVLGYENMTAVSTGTGPFPTEAQVSGGAGIYAAISAGSNPVRWAFYADSRSFYFVTCPYSNSDPSLFATRLSAIPHFFGDPIPRGFVDKWSTTLIASNQPASITSYGGQYYLGGDQTSYSHSPRAQVGTGTAVSTRTISLFGNAIFAYSGPDTVSGRFLLCEIAVFGGTGAQPVRAIMPGVLMALYSQSEVLTPWGVTAKASGRNYKTHMLSTSSGATIGSGERTVWFDVTGPWRTA